MWGILKDGRDDYFHSAAPDALDAPTRLYRPGRTRRLLHLLVPRRSRDRHQPAPRLGPVPVHEADALPWRLFDAAPRERPPPRQLSPAAEGGWSSAQGRPLSRVHHHAAGDADGSHLKVRGPSRLPSFPSPFCPSRPAPASHQSWAGRSAAASPTRILTRFLPPQHIAHVQKNAFNNYRKGPLFKDVMQQVLGEEGIFVADGHQWQ